MDEGADSEIAGYGSLQYAGDSEVQETGNRAQLHGTVPGSHQEDVIEVNLSSEEDEVIAEEDDDDDDEATSHPSRQPGWVMLTLAEREKALDTYRRNRRQAQKSSVRVRRKYQAKEEGYNWSLKPRRITEVLSALALSVADVFPTKQQLQLRIAEVCNALNKIPR